GKPPPADPRLRLLRAKGFAQLGQFKKAEAEFQAAIDLRPEDATFWIARGRFHAERGDHKKADADFAKAASLTPDELNKFIEAGWWFPGPYPEDLKAACPPEKNPDPSKPVAAGTGQGDAAKLLPWRSAPTDNPHGVLWLHYLFNHAPRISTYALTYVYSPGERTTTLHVGGTTQVRVWLNGRLVFEAAPAAGYEWQLFRVPVTLQARRNTLLAKVSNPGGPIDKFILRVGDNPFDRA